MRKHAKDLQKGDVVLAGGAEFPVTNEPTDPDENGLVVVWLDGFVYHNHGFYVVQWFEFEVKDETPEDRFRRLLGAFNTINQDRIVQAARDSGLL